MEVGIVGLIAYLCTENRDFREKVCKFAVTFETNLAGSINSLAMDSRLLCQMFLFYMKERSGLRD